MAQVPAGFFFFLFSFLHIVNETTAQTPSLESRINTYKKRHHQLIKKSILLDAYLIKQ